MNERIYPDVYKALANHLTSAWYSGWWKDTCELMHHD